MIPPLPHWRRGLSPPSFWGSPSFFGCLVWPTKLRLQAKITRKSHKRRRRTKIPQKRIMSQTPPFLYFINSCLRCRPKWGDSSTSGNAGESRVRRTIITYRTDFLIHSFPRRKHCQACIVTPWRRTARSSQMITPPILVPAQQRVLRSKRTTKRWTPLSTPPTRAWRTARDRTCQACIAQARVWTSTRRWPCPATPSRMIPLTWTWISPVGPPRARTAISATGRCRPPTTLPHRAMQITWTITYVVPSPAIRSPPRTTTAWSTTRRPSPTSRRWFASSEAQSSNCPTVPPTTRTSETDTLRSTTIWWTRTSSCSRRMPATSSGSTSWRIASTSVIPLTTSFRTATYIACARRHA